ncbi:MAG: mannose-1-phosphate guanylyltransferase [Bacteroidales bacterium]|jgi:mannose-1-phosphate guanylyltransferase
MKNRYVLIMAGGVGSRFWPLSRKEKPKQFLDILGKGETLIQQTFRRFRSVCPEANIFVVTSAEHKELVIEQLGIKPDRVLAEPLRRNTAPCIAYGIFRIKSEDPDAIVAVTPSDHIIEKEDIFINVINTAYDFSSASKALLTLGITPDRPETGYGYIQANKKKPVAGFEGLVKVKTFTEKPDLELAKVFLGSGDFYWNSGIFIWSVDSILEAFEKYLPDIYTSFDDSKKSFGTKKEESAIAQTYASCRSISIDYGIMEKADNVYVLCADVGWSDLGTWSTLYEHSSPDRNGNTVVRGNIFSYDNNGNVINVAKGKVAVLQGLKDYIIVDEDDVLLIVRKDQEQKIKYYLEDVKKRTGEEYL